MTDDFAIRMCARAAHEVNRSYCLAIGDDPIAPWEHAQDWQIKSAINGVHGVLRGNTPEESHDSWLAWKAEEGWTYGPIKDADKKEHPCFVPYAELPEAQKRKDALFVKTVRAMAEALNLPIERHTHG